MRTWLFLAGLVLLAGCGTSTTQLTTESSQKITVPEINEPLPPTRIGLWRDGKKVRPGDSVATAMEAFERPKSAVAVSDLPPGFPATYRAKGWEDENEGFAVLATGGQTVAAIRTEYGVVPSRVAEVTKEYQEEHGFPDSEIHQPNVDYWFWERPPYRLVICAARDADRTLVMTSAMGYGEVLDALTLSVEGAQRETAAVLRLAKNGAE